MLSSWAWVFFTLCGAITQTARNAMQRDLIAALGPIGAAFVRFLYGLPFALLFLALAIWTQDGRTLAPNAATWAWTSLGAGAQIGGTALMLAAMRVKSFVVVTAYTKTEPIQAALFGATFLHETLSARAWGAIALASLGVALTAAPQDRGSTAPQDQAPVAPQDETPAPRGGMGPALLGIAAAALFALSAVAFRAGVLALEPSFLGASTVLTLSLAVQSAAILCFLVLWDRAGLRAIARAWRRSIAPGFVGALGSQFWFIAFALETAARVRTLALVEIVFAQIVTRRAFHQTTRRIELVGMAMIALGVGVLLAS